MDLATIETWFTLDKIMDLIRQYRSLGPIPGILLPMFEALLPFLPLFIFVMANTNAFGLWLGFFYSWLGACIGAFLVFFIIRRFGQKKLLSFLSKHPKIQKLVKWIERHGFGPIFLLICFPFTPSAVINVVAGLSKMRTAQYMLALIIGKMVMVFTISFVGYDLHSLLTKPFRTIMVTMIIIILWYVGKRIEVRLNKSIETPANGKADRSRG